MAAEGSFYAVDVPGATVYVNTDSFVQAGEVTIFRGSKFRCGGLPVGDPSRREQGGTEICLARLSNIRESGIGLLRSRKSKNPVNW